MEQTRRKEGGRKNKILPAFLLIYHCIIFCLNEEAKEKERKENIPPCHWIHLSCTSFSKTSRLGGSKSATFAEIKSFSKGSLYWRSSSLCCSFSNLLTAQKPRKKSLQTVSFKYSPSQRGSFCSLSNQI